MLSWEEKQEVSKFSFLFLFSFLKMILSDDQLAFSVCMDAMLSALSFRFFFPLNLFIYFIFGLLFGGVNFDYGVTLIDFSVYMIFLIFVLGFVCLGIFCFKPRRFIWVHLFFIFFHCERLRNSNNFVFGVILLFRTIEFMVWDCSTRNYMFCFFF